MSPVHISHFAHVLLLVGVEIDDTPRVHKQRLLEEIEDTVLSIIAEQPTEQSRKRPR